MWNTLIYSNKICVRFAKNYKSLLKEFKVINKWKNRLCTLIRILIIVNSPQNDLWFWNLVKIPSFFWGGRNWQANSKIEKKNLIKKIKINKNKIYT